MSKDIIKILDDILTLLYVEQDTTYKVDENSKDDYLIKRGRMDGLAFAIDAIENIVQPTAEDLFKGE